MGRLWTVAGGWRRKRELELLLGSWGAAFGRMELERLLLYRLETAGRGDLYGKSSTSDHRRVEGEQEKEDDGANIEEPL